METGGAARCLRVLSPTAVIELGSVGRIIRSQFIVPSMRQDKKASVVELDLSTIERLESDGKNELSEKNTNSRSKHLQLLACGRIHVVTGQYRFFPSSELIKGLGKKKIC